MARRCHPVHLLFADLKAILIHILDCGLPRNDCRDYIILIITNYIGTAYAAELLVPISNNMLLNTIRIVLKQLGPVRYVAANTQNGKFGAREIIVAWVII